MELGSRIVEARKQLGLTQAELSQLVGLERSTLAKIENGQRKVSALELGDIARQLKLRLEWFVLPRGSAIAYRAKTTPEWTPRALDHLLEQAVDNTRLLKELQYLTLPQRGQTLHRPQSAAEAEELGATARTRAKLPQGAVENLADSAYRLGLLVFAAPLQGDADAAYMGHEDWGVAYINSENAIGRRRLALAHEIGHFLVGDAMSMDFRLDIALEDRHEALLDRAARAILLPPNETRSEWEILTSAGTREAAVRLASKYRVDMSTLARRLSSDLHIVDERAASEIRQTRTTRADIIEHGLYVPHDLEGVWQAPEYQKAVLRAYRSEGISAERALSLLQGTLA
ncbi:MAG: XRE family transcriptional regulator [Propionibacteriaceae bacterium]|nr:XRE family transcriptional regulator [Propionibacteriaceae bacterium]